MKTCRLHHLPGLYLIAALLSAAPASAALVNVCDEANLRAVLAGGGTVNFGCDGVIQLTNTLVISQNTVLDGTGHAITISGGGTTRPFIVNNGVQFTLKAVTVANGFGAPHGGALWNNGSAHLIDCTLSNNVALGAPSFGGAIFHGSGSLGVAGCTFANNRALGTNSFVSAGGAIGGGLFGQSGAIGITNSTFYGNGASGPATVSSGAISITCSGGANGAVSILNCTFAFNTNGAISYCNSFGPNRMVIENTILAYNNGPNCSGVMDGGHNISSDASGGFNHPFSLENMDPQLGPLANNGGPIPILTLLPSQGSPAIDGGASNHAPPTDQRGIARPSGVESDIGAVELELVGTNSGVLQFTVISNVVTEANSNLPVSVVRAGGLAGTASVNFATSNSSADSGSDYVATNGTLVFAPGQRSNSFSVAIFDDGSVESPESINLNLSDPTGGATLGRASASVTILDNDVGLSFATVSYAVPESVGSVAVTVTRRGSLTSAVSVHYSTAPGTAGAGSDYQSVTGTLTLIPGQASASFNVPIPNDTQAESDESFLVSLSNPSGGAVLEAPFTTTIAILDDDGVRVVADCTDSSLRSALAVGGKVRLACDGTIVLTNTITVSRNASLDGDGQQVTISGSDAMQVFSVGGGVEFSLTNLTIANGRSAFPGGGIGNSGTLNVANCTFVGNQATNTFTSGAGGAIHNRGTLRAIGCTFITNSAAFVGGAISSGYGIGPTPAGSAFVTNCTFVGNICLSGAAVSASFAGPVFIVNSTFADNIGASVSTATMINTIVSGSSIANCGPVTDGGHNISSDGSCGFTHPFSLNNTDPKLGALANHGGPTLTVSLLDGSPATDAANPAACPPTDQRGSVRPYGIGCDIGAFETTLIGTNPGTFQLTTGTVDVSELLSELVIKVLRADGAFGTATVNFATSDISATAGADYAVTNGTLVFAPGEVQKSLSVRLLNDAIQESDESFTVTLSAPAGGATLGNPQVSTVTIIDDETPAVVTVCDDASLRAAMAARPTVVLSCDGTILLTNTIVVSKSVSIDGAGHNVAISGGNAVRLFVVQSGVTLTLQNLSLVDGLAVGTNGNTGQPGGPGEGGAIYNDGGSILASDCAFLRNQARGGPGGPSPQFGPSGTGGLGRGGVAYNAPGGRITISSCEFKLNQAVGGTAGTGNISSGAGGDGAGGIIYNAAGILRLSDCLVLSNRVVSGRGRRLGGLSGSGVAYGGAIANSGGDVTAARVTMADNASIAEYLNAAHGGAFHHSGGALTLSESRLAGNQALAGRGLGIGSPFGIAGGNAFGGAVSVAFGTVSILDTTLNSNSAVGGTEPGGGSIAGSAFGGAIYNAADVWATNSTIADNKALSGQARPGLNGRALGGGLHNNGGNISVSHVTISGNAASHSGGGVVGHFFGGGVYSTNGTMALFDSIVANSPSGSNCFGTIIDGGHNISSDASCNFTALGSLNNTDPVLGPLADYGGPTPTMALLSGSPAIDAAGAESCPATDQRGIARPFGAACDIGAFESSPPYTILGRITGFTTPNSGLSVSAGTSAASVPPGGEYALHGLTAGSYVVTPSSPEAVFVLSNRVVDAVRDTIGVDFHSYRSNALVIERIGAGVTRSVFAGEAGQTYNVELSTSLSSWTPYSTNVAQSSGLFEFNDTNTVPVSPRMFRVVKP